MRAAQAAVAEHQQVTALDVVVGLGWAHAAHLDQWRQGRVSSLEAVVDVSADKLTAALEELEGWARDQGLQPTEADHLARTRDRRPLQFTESADPEVERRFRILWGSPELSEAQRARRAERASPPPDLVVIAPLSEFSCDSCGGSGELLVMDDAAALCLTCADLDHLVFLPAGDATLTRRARKASSLSAVVVRFSRARKRYERQGILVEEPALAQAEQACLADAEARTRRRERDAQRRAEQDDELRAQLVEAIRARFPGCPPERAEAIAAHTAARGSGRVGRSAAGRKLDPAAVELAVAAAVRHHDTDYDELLMAGLDRHTARAQVADDVEAILTVWRSAPAANETVRNFPT